ncbi:hypothetical protein KCU81_g64, partial [Aureobasidium melanogenum]
MGIRRRALKIFNRPFRSNTFITIPDQPRLHLLSQALESFAQRHPHTFLLLDKHLRIQKHLKRLSPNLLLPSAVLLGDRGHVFAEEEGVEQARETVVIDLVGSFPIGNELDVRGEDAHVDAATKGLSMYKAFGPH